MGRTQQWPTSILVGNLSGRRCTARRQPRLPEVGLSLIVGPLLRRERSRPTRSLRGRQVWKGVRQMRGRLDVAARKEEKTPWCLRKLTENGEASVSKF